MSLDQIRDSLKSLWTALDDEEIFLVLDEDGNNVAGGQYRSAGDGVVLYVDDIDGYQLMPATRIKNLACRPASA